MERPIAFLSNSVSNGLKEFKDSLIWEQVGNAFTMIAHWALIVGSTLAIYKLGNMLLQNLHL